MEAVGMSSTADIVIVMEEGFWEALIVEDSKVIYSFGKTFDTVETALRVLLEALSSRLFCKLKNQIR